MKKTNHDTEMEDKLIDFTDRVLAGRSGQPDSNADEELRHLEETILRLKRSLPQTEPDKAMLQQFDARLMTRLRQEQKTTAVSFWRKWFGWVEKHGLFRPQAAVGMSLLVLAVLAVISALVFPINGSSVIASTLINSRAVIAVIALTGLILALAWIHRRK